MNAGHWSVRTHAAFSVIAWCCALNAMWIAFTLLGGVVAGIGPATLAACILTRRRMRGESVGLRDFAVTWRAELVRGSVVVLPVLAVAVILLSNYAFFSSLGPGATVPRLVTLAAFGAIVAAGAYVGPMYAHYDLPLRSYVSRSMRFALARPVSTIIVLFVFAAIAFTTGVMPVLLFTVSIGAWLQTSTWLCVRFFEENEDRLADAARPGPPQHLKILPSEPLRIR
jgi:uncharacterized membrane protein YesL